MNMEVSPGQIAAICGRVGSGKTTWASGLLSINKQTGGELEINGKTAYVRQSTQILNETVRSNIIFGSKYEEEWYEKVIEACALDEDMKQFPGGDLTEIGEKGITISGGQK